MVESYKQGHILTMLFFGAVLGVALFLLRGQISANTNTSVSPERPTVIQQTIQLPPYVHPAPSKGLPSRITQAVLARAKAGCTPEIAVASGIDPAQRQSLARAQRQLVHDWQAMRGMRNVHATLVGYHGKLYSVLYGETCG